MKKWVLLTTIAVPVMLVAAAVAVVAFAWLSITIVRTPSCLTYQSERNAELGGMLQASIADYLTAHGFEVISLPRGAIQGKSRLTSVDWNSGTKLLLRVCTQDEASSDWLTVAQDFQEIAVHAHWSPETYLQVNPDVSGCTRGNDVLLGYPVDFKTIKSSMEGVKATCTGRRGE